MVSRETVHRHRSERLIDRFLLRAERTRTEQLQERLQQLEKRKNFAVNVKRRKLEEAKAAQEAQEKEKAEKEALRDKYEKLDAEGALDRILKHILSPKKFSKCLVMVSKLIEEHFDFLQGESLFRAFDTVMKFKNRFAQEADRKLIEKLYFKLVELSSQAEEFDDVALFSERQTALLDLYYDAVYIQSAVYSDDAFKLNEVMTALQRMLPSMEPYRQAQDTHREYFSMVMKPHSSVQKVEHTTEQESAQKNDDAQADQEGAAKAGELQSTTEERRCYTFSSDAEFRDYLAGMQRWIYMETICLMHTVFRKKPIASKTTLLQTIRATYLAKEKFNEEEEDKLAEMLSELKRDGSVAQKAQQAQSMMDSRIKGSLLEGTERAVDARAEKIQIETATAKWASKQSGL